MTEHAYTVIRTQVWEFAPGDAEDEEHAMAIAEREPPNYDDYEVEERDG